NFQAIHVEPSELLGLFDTPGAWRAVIRGAALSCLRQSPVGNRPRHPFRRSAPSRNPTETRAAQIGGKQLAAAGRGERPAAMSYVVPSDLVKKMVDAGEAKIFMSTRDTLLRAYMAGALLTLGAAFAVTVAQQTGHPIIGAMLFPVGFCML